MWSTNCVQSPASLTWRRSNNQHQFDPFHRNTLIDFMLCTSSHGRDGREYVCERTINVRTFTQNLSGSHWVKRLLWNTLHEVFLRRGGRISDDPCNADCVRKVRLSENVAVIFFERPSWPNPEPSCRTRWLAPKRRRHFPYDQRKIRHRRRGEDLRGCLQSNHLCWFPQLSVVQRFWRLGDTSTNTRMYELLLVIKSGATPLRGCTTFGK